MGEIEITPERNRHVLITSISDTTPSRAYLQAITATGITQAHEALYERAIELVKSSEASEVAVSGGSFEITVVETGRVWKKREFQAIGNLPGLRIRK